MVTRRDVARRAGTSEAVVSYVLNGGPRNVAPRTRERVVAAIRELGYRPNAVARSLRTSRSTMIGLVVPDNANPFFAELAREIEDVAFERGYTLLLGNARDDDDREAAHVRALLDHQVDGLILIPSHGPGTWRAELERSNVPCLVVDREIEGTNAMHVLTDNEGGAHEGVRHLLGHGRSRIGCLGGPEGIHPTVDRVAGWRRALTEAGHDPAAMPLVHAPFGQADGFLAGRGLLSGSGVDAIFVTSDEQAVGVLRAAADLGVRIPDEVAVCSFDGIAATAYTVPSLTTVRQPFEELGRSAVELLLAHHDTPARPDDIGATPQRVVLPTRLIARGSCGCADPAGADV